MKQFLKSVRTFLVGVVVGGAIVAYLTLDFKLSVSPANLTTLNNLTNK